MTERFGAVAVMGLPTPLLAMLAALAFAQVASLASAAIRSSVASFSYRVNRQAQGASRPWA